jgi:cell wall-associated NlpC family hydrolase
MKQLLIILFFGSTFTYANEVNVDAKRDSIIAYAQSFISTPYVWGGTSPKGFDCSGFLYYVYKHFGIKVSRASSGYQNFGQKMVLEDVKPADILLFTGTDPKRRKIGHVGIVLKNSDGIIEFIHSSSSKRHFGVTVTRYNESGYVKRFLKAITIF